MVERNGPIEILLVEDNPGDVRLTKEALKEGKVYSNLHTVKDGVEALEFLRRAGQVRGRAAPGHHPARPEPAEEGRARGAGRRSRPTTMLKRIPVVVLTTSKAEEDVLRTYDLHANCYVTKPVDLEKFIVVVKSIDVFWLTVVTLAAERQEQVDDAQRPPDRGQPGRRAPDRGDAPRGPAGAVRLHHADRLSRGLEHLSNGETALVLLDLSLPDSIGLETFARVYAHSPTVPIIVLTGNDDQTVALSAVKGGAQDYLVKGRLDRELLLRSMHYSIERKRYQVQLEHQANYDALTGLPNRNLLHDRLRQAVYAQRLPRAIAVVFIDLDHFKFVNDSLGHSTGDLLLKAMAERLRTVLREGDTVGRVGGDEFVLILNDQSNEEIIYRAMQRITAKVSEPITIDGKELYVTCSAGISLYPQDGRDVDTLLKNADAAMYRAKEHGRSNFQFYTSEMNERVNERLALENALRRALERQELVLHYQQKVNLQHRADRRRRGAGALAAPGVGPGAPGALHPARRGDRAHRRIGEWVLREACRQTRAWLDAGLEPRRGLGEPLGAPVPPGRPGAHRVAHPGGDAPRARAARDGAHREHGDAATSTRRSPSCRA